MSRIVRPLAAELSALRWNNADRHLYRAKTEGRGRLAGSLTS